MLILHGIKRCACLGLQSSLLSNYVCRATCITEEGTIFNVFSYDSFSAEIRISHLPNNARMGYILCICTRVELQAKDKEITNFYSYPLESILGSITGIFTPSTKKREMKTYIEKEINLIELLWDSFAAFY